MELWLSGELHVFVGDGYREVSNEVEAKVNAVLGGRDYGDGLREWAFIAMIFGDLGPAWYKEVTRYSRKNRSYESRLKIDYANFKAADFAGRVTRVTLLCQALLKSLDRLETLKIQNIDVPRLRQDFLEVIAACGWSPTEKGCVPGTHP
jgi:hypothetical protein